MNLLFSTFLFVKLLLLTTLAGAEVTTPQPLITAASLGDCRIEVRVQTRLNVRRSPWGEICNSFINGQLVDVTGGSGDWVRIRSCGGVAYVNKVGFTEESWSKVTGPQCSYSQQAPSTQSTADIPTTDSQIGWRGNNEFRAIAMNEVTEHGLDQLNPRDISAYCPNYGRMNPQQKRTFWSTFLYAMSIPESGMRPRLTYRESFSASCRLNGGQHISGRVISTGLVQVSACSCRGYGEPVYSLETLKDPKSNLSCAARILKKQIGRHGIIRQRRGSWKGASSYWSVVRNPTKNNQIKDTIRRTYRACY